MTEVTLKIPEWFLYAIIFVMILKMVVGLIDIHFSKKLEKMKKHYLEEMKKLVEHLDKAREKST